MKVEINREACIGCGVCVNDCPKGYELDNEGKAVLKDISAPCLKIGADNCPVSAIVITGAVAQEKDLNLCATPKPKGIDDAKDVWVFAEQRGGKLSKAAIELLGCARDLARELKQEVVAVLLGKNINDLAKELIGYQADKVYVADDPELENYRTLPYARVITNLINEHKPRIFLFGATLIGRDLAPRIAQKVTMGLTADCTELTICPDTGLLNQTRPAFGGNIMATIQTPRHRTQMATVRPGIMKAKPFDEKRNGKIIPVKMVLEKSDFIATIIEIAKDERHHVNLDEARIIVSGGRGVGSKDGFNLIAELAEVLTGEVGGSRVAVEKGWVNQAHQVGQTGKTVSPELYIACGISGAIQHKVGMSKSKVVVAINKDPNAQILQVSDYAIIGDLFEVIPQLIATLREEIVK